MPEFKVEIKNISQIRSAFRKAPILMIRNLDRAIAKSIFSIKADSQRKSPVDTGFLRASHSQSFKTLYGETGPQAYYSLFVHEGTKYIRGRPFLMESVKQNQSKVEGYFEQAVQDTLDEISRDAN